MRIAQQLGEDARGNGRGNLTAVKVSAARVVDHDEHGKDRILHGRKAAERSDVTPLHIARGIEADLLCRSCFARDAVAAHTSLRSAARRNNLLEEPDQCTVHRLLQCLADLLRLALLIDGAVRILDLTHNVRPHQRPAVRDRRHRRHELQRRHGNALPDCCGRNIRVPHILGFEEDSLLLAGQVNARLLAKAEEPRVVHQFFRTERQANLGESCIE